jgi:uncharacterized protein
MLARLTFIASLPRKEDLLMTTSLSAPTPTPAAERPWALITGASVGIGAALAAEYAAHGYNLVLVARRGDAMARLGDELARKHQVEAIPLAKDLLLPGAVEQVVDELQSRGLAVDALVNNAGFGTNGPFARADLGRQLAMIQLNIGVMTEMTHRLLPSMIARRRGHVLNVGSTGSFQPGPFMAVYCATKAYVLSFSEALWEELRGTGVTVTALCPGATESEFAEVSGTKTIPMFRKAKVMSAEEVARKGFAKAARGARLCIPGFRNAMMAKSVGWAPRGMVLRVARGMLEAQA